jgi:hypothetical protein
VGNAIANNRWFHGLAAKVAAKMSDNNRVIIFVNVYRPMYSRTESSDFHDVHRLSTVDNIHKNSSKF